MSETKFMNYCGNSNLPVNIFYLSFFYVFIYYFWFNFLLKHGQLSIAEGANLQSVTIQMNFQLMVSVRTFNLTHEVK